MKKESWLVALHPEGVCSFSQCFIEVPCFLCKRDQCWTCGCSSSGSYSCHLIQRTAVGSCISTHVGDLCKHAKSVVFVHGLTFMPGGCSCYQVDFLFTSFLIFFFPLFPLHPHQFIDFPRLSLPEALWCGHCIWPLIKLGRKSYRLYQCSWSIWSLWFGLP